MDKITAFLRHSWEEVQHNVTWPKFSELQASSTLVLLASLIFALLVGLIDFVFENGLHAFYQSF
jgi:preprotein translocase subunit SecE